MTRETVEFSEAFRARYEVLEPLGQGGMGQVLLARCRADSRDVAIKTILAGCFADDEARARFLSEAKITGKLSHPAVVRLIESGQDGDRLYLVLELVSGGDLNVLLQRHGPLAPGAFFRIALPVLDGLAHAHAAGILHRDIKSANILLDAEGRPRIADFGLAKDLAGSGMRTATGILMGTPSYMAPELVRGERATAAADQYALGVLLWEMLTAKKPFAAPDPFALMRMHVEDPLPALAPLRADVPAPLAAAVRRALAKSPEDRFESVAALCAAVSDVERTAGSDWSRHARVESTVAAAPDAIQPPRPVRRTGSQKVVGRRTSGGITVVTTPPAPPPSTARRVALVALVGLALLAVLAAAAAMRRPAATPSPSARLVVPDRLDPRIERRIDHAVVRWDPELAGDVRVTRDGAVLATAAATAAVRIDGLTPSRSPAVLELTWPGGTRRSVDLEFSEVSVERVRSRLQELLKLRDVKQVYAAFAGVVPRVCSFEERHPGSAEKHRALAARCDTASGLTRLIRMQLEMGLVDALQQASDLLGDKMMRKSDKMALIDPAQKLADLHAFAELHGLIPRNEPARFLAGVGAGAGAFHARMYPGAGDYSRESWKLVLQEKPFDPGPELQAFQAARETPALTVAHELVQVAPIFNREKFVSVGLPMELEQDQGDFPAYAGRNYFLGVVPLDLLKGRAQKGNRCQIAVAVQATARVRLDLEMPGGFTLSYRIPVGLKGANARSAQTFLWWEVGANLLDHDKSTEMKLSLHSHPGDAVFTDIDGDRFGWWEMKVTDVVVRVHH